MQDPTFGYRDPVYEEVSDEERDAAIQVSDANTSSLVVTSSPKLRRAQPGPRRRVRRLGTTHALSAIGVAALQTALSR